MDHSPKSSMLGEFRVESVLGQGGSGIVYDATWGPRRVALKVLHPSLVGTGRERAQFLTEAQRLQQVAHPSVVKVLAVGQLPDGRPYLAMERLDGETLASVIARGALPLAQAFQMFEELCSAVAALHALGLVHRDLKPENVFVVANRHAVLLDFGIAKDLTAPASTTTQDGNVRGTPAYMAPERFFGQPAGIATDIYELALVLYMMLAGRLPWDEIADPEARLSPRALVDLVAIPDALDVEIRRALSTRAQNRPASATALFEAVASAASTVASEPQASSTLRLRSGNKAADEATLHEPSRTPSAEQHTPLAWAPTQLAAQTSGPAPKRRIAVAIGATAVAAIAVVAWVRLRDDRAPTRQSSSVAIPDAAIAQHAATFDPTDPWSSRPSEPPKGLRLDGEIRTASEYRAESASAIARLPSDTKFVFGMQLADVRANSQTKELLERLAANPRVAPVALLLPPCVKSLVADAEWFVLGAPSIAKSGHGSLVVRGRWSRPDVEGCLGDSVKAVVAKDGAKLFRLGDDGWLDFIDSHTAFVALESKLEAEALHALVTKPTGLSKALKAHLAELPAQRSVTFIVDGTSGDEWSALSLPTGSDLFGWIRVEESRLVLDLAADPHNDKAAAALVARIEPQLKDVFANTSADAVGKLEVVRSKTSVHVRGSLTSLMLGIVAASSGL
jgi:serine/threonine protein kinase